MIRKKFDPENARREKTVGIRVSEEYAEWLKRFSVSERIGVASLIDRALECYAAQVGHNCPPKRNA